MGKRGLEMGVGLFVIAAAACLLFLSVRLGRVELPGRRGYPVRAVFTSASGLGEGARIEIAGVVVGRVGHIALDGYRASVTLQIDSGVRLPDDSMASIRTRGLIGDKFITITPGASAKSVHAGGVFHDTEDAVDIEQLVSQYIHGKL